MSKKVLVVEPSLAVRGIAESLLRQYGFEVYTTGSAEPALDILSSSKIDLLLVGSEVVAPNGQRLIELLGADTSTAMVPLLLLHDTSAGTLDFPPEAIIPKPFTPREFMEKVALYGAVQSAPGTQEQSVSVKVTDLEDEIIDAALGLDKIEVSDAEVLGSDTGAYRLRNRKMTTESMIGYDYKASAEDSAITRKKIDEIKVPADQASAAAPPAEEAKAEFLGTDSARLKARPAEGMTASSKIEIVPDQFGIVLPQDVASQIQSETESSDHDYDWFVNEMKKIGPSADKETPSAADSGSLNISSPADTMHPAVAAPKSAPVSAAAGIPENKSSTHAEAVGKFISEFRKEVEKIAGEPIPSISISDAPLSAPASKASSGFDWVEAVEKISPAEVRAISNELIAAVGAKVAERLMARIEPEVVYQILKESFSETLNNLLKTKSRQG